MMHDMFARYRSRYFAKACHETRYASSEKKHFINISGHCQTYQNYEQLRQMSRNYDFQSHFLVLKIGSTFPKKSMKNI